MDTLQVNWLAVLLCGVAYMVLGSLWYSPMLFANPWMKELGLGKMGGGNGKDKLMKLMAISFVLSLFLAAMLGMMVKTMNAMTAVDGAKTGFLAWISFVAPVIGINYLYEGRSLKLYGITAGFMAITFVVMGAILGAMS